ncbi:MAG: hypothetical protein ABIR80_09190, partial [Opitutaceae bacterium]
YIGRMYESVKARPIYLIEGVYQTGSSSDGALTSGTRLADESARDPSLQANTVVQQPPPKSLS